MTDDTQDPKKPRKPAAKKAAPAKKAPAKKAARKAPARKVGKTPNKPAPKKESPKRLSKAEADKKVAESITSLISEANRSVGRPSEYKDEYVGQMIAFFNIRTQSIMETTVLDAQGNPKQDKEGNVITAKIPVVNTFPTFERFASDIGVTRQTLHHWAHEVDDDGEPVRPEFLYAYARARDLQAALTIEGSYGGVYESRAATLGLKNLAGWKDQLETHVEGTITTTTAEELEAVYQKGIANSRRMEEQAKNRVLYGTVPGVPTLPGVAVGVPPTPSDDEDDEA
jgi:hypothetical protein